MSLAATAIIATSTCLATLAGYWYAMGYQERANDLDDDAGLGAWLDRSK